jgi:predicted ATP-dependent endonuclease of OLD family
MSKNKFISFHVKRYRSLLDVKIDINDSGAVVICGENNIGKTNFLRALNVFFNHISQKEIYNPSEDIPHHIYFGSGGAGTKTELIGNFLIDGRNAKLKITFKNDGEITYNLAEKSCGFDVAKELLSKFHFLYVESNNINLPNLISVVLEKDGLLPLDSKRSKQSKPLKKLSEFIELSQRAISDIEMRINECFKQLTDFDGILKDKEIRINFAEFDKLRDIVKTMTSITLYDGNDHGIASKGSGAQRAVFLALIQFISQNSKRNIIWGIDEPEAFLQPRLQKEVARVLCKIAEERKQPIILTTHSQHFVNLNTLRSTYIFKGATSHRSYTRKRGEIFYEMSTTPIECKSDFEKAMLIKLHLGITNNDGWEVLPYNILVEGEEDKRYLEALFRLLDLPAPNIVWSGGASKIAGYLQYYNQFAKDLDYKPEFLCIFDNDAEGKEQMNKVKPKSYSHISVKSIFIPRYDGVTAEAESNAQWEIEDFLPPATILTVINKILKKDQYKIITNSQIKDREKRSHKGKGILKYAEECSSQQNPNKTTFELNEGRKKQICQIFSEQIYNLKLLDHLTEKNFSFLKGLIK